MDATLAKKAQDLAAEVATQASTVEELNEVFRSLMKTALERMLNVELESHLRVERDEGLDTVSNDGDLVLYEDDVEPKSKGQNRKHGCSRKSVGCDMGTVVTWVRYHSIFREIAMATLIPC